MNADERPADDEAGGTARVEDIEEWTLRDEDARAFVSAGVRGVSSLVRTTFGPKGLEKLVETETAEGRPELVLTGDAGELFAAIERGDGFSHPVSALLVDAVDSMGRALGDGSTTAVVVTEELVERGIDLVEKGLHPNAVTVGYAMAASMAGEILDDLARPVDATDAEGLAPVAATAMCGGLDAAVVERYADLVARAVVALAGASENGFIDTENCKVVGTEHAPTRLHEGVIVRRWPRGARASEGSDVDFDWTPDVPDPLTDARIALVDGEIDFEETATPLGEEWGAGVTAESPEEMDEYRRALRRRIRDAARRVRDLGVDVLVSMPAVDDRVRDAFEAAGVAVVDGVETPMADVHRLATASGATVVSHLDDLDESRLGTVSRVSEQRVGDEKWTVFTADGGVRSLVVGTKVEASAERCERIVSDALDATAVAAMDDQILPGAGAGMMAVATGLRERAPSVSGPEQLAIEAFADAMEGTFGALVANAGLDPLDARTALRRRHANAAERPASVGIDLATGEPVDAYEAAVVEPRRVFSQAIETARSTTRRLVTTDTVLHPGVDLGEFHPRTEHH